MLQGTFVADFESFYAACRKAEVSLKSFEDDAHKVEGSLNRMADAFSGRRVITEATMAANVIERMGGASRLTDTELRRVAGTTEEAIKKMRLLGMEVPANLTKLANASKLGAGSLDKLGTGLRQAEMAGLALGVSLPPGVGALSDLASLAGSSALKLGALGPVLAVVGAGLAGLKVGSVVGEWSGLTDQIAAGTSALMGWGDVIGERAAAKADMLAKASALAGRSITSVSDAMQINQIEAERMIAANTAASKTFEAEAKAAKTAAAEIARVHQSNFEKIVQTNRDMAKAIQDREETDRKANAEAVENAQKRQAADHEAAVKAQEDWAKSRNAFMEAEAAKAAEALKTAAALREQRLEAERIARNATTFADFSDPQQARALLARPERSREDFIRMYAGYSGGLEFAEQQYQVEQELRRRARRIVEADDALRRSESGGGSRGNTRAGGGDVNIQVSGFLDPRTVDEIATKVGNAVMRKTGVRMPVF